MKFQTECLTSHSAGHCGSLLNLETAYHTTLEALNLSHLMSSICWWTFHRNSSFSDWWILSSVFSTFAVFFLWCLCILTLRHILVISLDSIWTVHTKYIFHLRKRVSYLLLHGCLLWLLVLAWLSLDVLHQTLPVTLSHLCDFKVKLEPELLNFSFYFEDDQPIQSIINSSVLPWAVKSCWN